MGILQNKEMLFFLTVKNWSNRIPKTLSRNKAQKNQLVKIE